MLFSRLLLQSTFRYASKKVGSQVSAPDVNNLRRPTTLSSQPSADESVRQQLKTYLEVLSPKQIFDIVESKQKNVSTLLSVLKKTLEPVGELYDKQIEKHLLKNSKYLTPHQIKDIIKINHVHGQGSRVLAKVEKRVLNKLVLGAEETKLLDLINVAYALAKVNKKNPELMKALEKRVVEEKIPLDASVIRKILFTFTHLNLGTATLYSEVCRTIKVGQHELNPLDTAEFAYHLSKVQENAKGGFGVFQIAERQLCQYMRAYDFNTLTKVAGFMLVQNIGSNKFQEELEDRLYTKFPNELTMDVNSLIRLLKAVSGYVFKFKDQALLQTLDNASVKNVAYCSTQQLQQMLWSWGRASRGSAELWQKLENHYMQKYLLLKPRDLAFAIDSFCRNPRPSKTNILNLMLQRFLELNNQEVRLHNYVKVMMGLQQPTARQGFDVLLKLSQTIVGRMDRLTRDEFLTFLTLLGDSDLHYESQGVDELKQAITKQESRLLSVIDYIGLAEGADLLYLWVKLGQHEKMNSLPETKKFIDTLLKVVEDDVLQIPKKNFLKALFSFTIMDRYEPVFRMMPILYELRKYGPLGYFFPPHQYPLLAYCVYVLRVHGKQADGTPLPVPVWLLKQTQNYLSQLDPRTLNQFENKIYAATQELVNKSKEAPKRSEQA